MTKIGTISQLLLEQYLLGELSAKEESEVEAILATDPVAAETVKELERSSQSFLIRFPPSPGAAEIEARLGKSSSTQRSPLYASKSFRILTPALAALLLVLLIIHPWRSTPPVSRLIDPETDATTVKGDLSPSLNRTQLLVYRLQNRRVELMQSGETAGTGDLLQLAYVSAGKGFGMIFSVDGRGRLSLHFPKSETASGQLEQNKKIPLPEAIELDNAPSFERFFFLTADQPIDIGQVLKLVAAFTEKNLRSSPGTITFPEGIEYDLFIVKKKDAP